MKYINILIGLLTMLILVAIATPLKGQSTTEDLFAIPTGDDPFEQWTMDSSLYLPYPDLGTGAEPSQEFSNAAADLGGPINLDEVTKSELLDPDPTDRQAVIIPAGDLSEILAAIAAGGGVWGEGGLPTPEREPESRSVFIAKECMRGEFPKFANLHLCPCCELPPISLVRSDEVPTSMRLNDDTPSREAINCSRWSENCGAVQLRF